jgi:hypothetical protein
MKIQVSLNQIFNSNEVENEKKLEKFSFNKLNSEKLLKIRGGEDPPQDEPPQDDKKVTPPDL